MTSAGSIRGWTTGSQIVHEAFAAAFSPQKSLGVLSVQSSTPWDKPKYHVIVSDFSKKGKDKVIPIGEVFTKPVLALAFSPDGSLLALGPDNNSVAIRSTANYRTVTELKGHTDDVNCVAFSANGSYVVSGSSDNSVRVWNVLSQRQIRVLKGHTSEVMAVSFSPNTKYVASGSNDKSVRIWDLETGQNRNIGNKHRFESEPSAVAFSPCGTYLAFADGDKLIIWDVKGDKVFCKPAPQDVNDSRVYTGYIVTIAWSFDSKYVVTGSEDQAVLWNITTRSVVNYLNLEHDSGTVVLAAFDPANRYILTVHGEKGSKYTWDPKTGKLL
jgi:WD40 repeat protein